MVPPPSLLDPFRLRALLQGICVDAGWRVLEVRSVELVKERPGVHRTYRYRLVAERGTGAPRELIWYGKEYRSDEGERCAHRIRQLRLAAPARVHVPEPLGYSERARLLVMADLRGTPLVEIVGRFAEDAILATLARIGGALAQLHRLGGGAARQKRGISFHRHGPNDEAADLAGSAASFDLTPIGPRCSKRFHEVLEEVRAELTSSRVDEGPRHDSLLHRDLHPAQIVLDGDGIGLLHLDEVALGEAELDLGSLGAHLVLLDLQREGKVRHAPARIEALQSGYETERATRPERLAAYTSAALLRLAALGGFSDQRPSILDWPRLAAALITEATKTLAARPSPV